MNIYVMDIMYLHGCSIPLSKQRALATGRLAVQFVEILTNPGRNPDIIVVQLALNTGGPRTE